MDPEQEAQHRADDGIAHRAEAGHKNGLISYDQITFIAVRQMEQKGSSSMA